MHSAGAEAELIKEKADVFQWGLAIVGWEFTRELIGLYIELAGEGGGVV